MPGPSRPLSLLCLAAVGCISCMGGLQVTVEEDEEQPTLLWVSWSTDEASEGQVEAFIDDESVVLVSSEQPARDHRVPVFGLPPGQELRLEVSAWTGLDRWKGKEELVTGGLAALVPDFHAQATDGTHDLGEPYVLQGVGATDWSGLLVLDRSGRVVWNHAIEPNCYFVETGMLPGMPGAQGMAWCDKTMSRYRVPFDPREAVEVTELPDGHHAFANLPDGAFAYCFEDCRSYWHEGIDDEVHVCGDGLRVLEPDGSIWDLFNVWDWAEPAESVVRDTTASLPGDWTHANAIDYHPGRGTLLFSLRNLREVIEVELATGEVVAEHGQADGAPGFSEGVEPFYYQHDANWVGADHLLMVSTPQDEDGSLSRETYAVEYALQEGTGLLEEAWSYHPGPDIFSHSGGGARRLENGDTLVHWRDPRARIRQISAEGEIVWDLAARASADHTGTPQAFRSFYQVEEDD